MTTLMSPMGRMFGGLSRPGQRFHTSSLYATRCTSKSLMYESVPDNVRYMCYKLVIPTGQTEKHTCITSGIHDTSDITKGSFIIIIIYQNSQIEYGKILLVEEIEITSLINCIDKYCLYNVI